MNEKIFTIKEVSDLLKVHPNTVHNWLQIDSLPYIKIKGVIRIMESQLGFFLNQHRKNEPPSGIDIEQAMKYDENYQQGDDLTNGHE